MVRDRVTQVTVPSSFDGYNEDGPGFRLSTLRSKAHAVTDRSIYWFQTINERMGVNYLCYLSGCLGFAVLKSDIAPFSIERSILFIVSLFLFTLAVQN